MERRRRKGPQLRPSLGSFEDEAWGLVEISSWITLLKPASISLMVAPPRSSQVSSLGWDVAEAKVESFKLKRKIESAEIYKYIRKMRILTSLVTLVTTLLDDVDGFIETREDTVS